MKKVELWPIFEFFGQPKWAPFKRSTRLCTGRSQCGYKEEKGVRDKKRDRHTENALDGSKRHANYGLSLPMSIPTLGESLAQFYVAQIAQIQSIYYLLFGRRLCRSAWRRRAATSSSKVGPVWRTFFIICAGRKSPFFWRNFGFYGLCRFKWPGLYIYLYNQR